MATRFVSTAFEAILFPPSSDRRTSRCCTLPPPHKNAPFWNSPLQWAHSEHVRLFVYERSARIHGPEAHKGRWQRACRGVQPDNDTIRESLLDVGVADMPWEERDPYGTRFFVLAFKLGFQQLRTSHPAILLCSRCHVCPNIFVVGWMVVVAMTRHVQKTRVVCSMLLPSGKRRQKPLDFKLYALRAQMAAEKLTVVRSSLDVHRS